ncbi:MAG: glycosyltransferase family 4 protein [Clostridia bacterium]|nr:glycosyltransferase family 4 protein [Clostridia bacterium]
MKVLIVAQYLDNIQDPQTYNSRFLTVADRLLENGHDVQIVTTDFIHSIKQHVTDVTAYKTASVTLLHEPGYPKNVCLQRFKSHYLLSKQLKAWLKTIEKPDVIYCAVPSLDFAYEAAKYARKAGIRFVLDIQDLWPEAFEMVLNIPVVGSLCFLPLRLRANAVYRAADHLLAVSNTYIDRAKTVNKKASSGAVFLGTDVTRFDSFRESDPVLSKEDNAVWLGYAGTLGHSYDLKTVMQAMAMINDHPRYADLRLIVMGDGPLREEFERFAADCVPDHAVFTGKLPYPQMVATLCRCDIAVNPIRKRSAGSIINKHGDYAAAGIPVINTQESPEYRALVEQYQMGINAECENAAEVAAALKTLLDDPQTAIAMGERAAQCARELFARETTYVRIVDAIECQEG